MVLHNSLILLMPDRRDPEHLVICLGELSKQRSDINRITVLRRPYLLSDRILLRLKNHTLLSELLCCTHRLIPMSAQGIQLTLEICKLIDRLLGLLKLLLLRPDKDCDLLKDWKHGSRLLLHTHILLAFVIEQSLITL